MMGDKKLEKALMECYTRLYKEATPSADFNQLLTEWQAAGQAKYLDYYLPDNRQTEIIEEIIKEFKIKPKRKAREFSVSVVLGLSPRGA